MYKDRYRNESLLFFYFVVSELLERINIINFTHDNLYLRLNKFKVNVKSLANGGFISIKINVYDDTIKNIAKIKLCNSIIIKTIILSKLNFTSNFISVKQIKLSIKITFENVDMNKNSSSEILNHAESYFLMASLVFAKRT